MEIKYQKNILIKLVLHSVSITSTAQKSERLKQGFTIQRKLVFISFNSVLVHKIIKVIWIPTVYEEQKKLFVYILYAIFLMFPSKGDYVSKPLTQNTSKVWEMSWTKTLLLSLRIISGTDCKKKICFGQNQWSNTE